MLRERWKVAVITAAALGAGLFAGVIGAGAAGAYNTGGWIGGTEFLSRAEGFQSGYVAGVADAMSHVAHNAAQDVDWVQRARCLDRDSGLTASRTGYLSTLRDWAKDVLRERSDDASHYHAAAILIINACR